MFAGIVEATSTTMGLQQGQGSIQIKIGKPSDFNDLKIGDSICCNGVCLTIEKFDEGTMSFSVGLETLKVTGWRPADLEKMTWNLERSLKFGDRIHGHLVSGHVDSVGKVTDIQDQGDCWVLKVALPKEAHKYVWEKGSITLNGISLTVNEFSNGELSVCLVPETIRKTNIRDLKLGQAINVETDYLMKGMLAHAHAPGTH